MHVPEIVGGCPQNHADWSPRQGSLHVILEATQRKARSRASGLLAGSEKIDKLIPRNSYSSYSLNTNRLFLPGPIVQMRKPRLKIVELLPRSWRIMGDKYVLL